MIVDKKIELSGGYYIEFGAATWSDKERSVRNRYDDPTTKRFLPHNSSEIPFEDLTLLVEYSCREKELAPELRLRMLKALLTDM